MMHKHILFIGEATTLHPNGISFCARLAKKEKMFITYFIVDGGLQLTSSGDQAEQLTASDQDMKLSQHRADIQKSIERIHGNVSFSGEYHLEYVAEKEFEGVIEYLTHKNFQFDLIVTDKSKRGFFERIFFQNNEFQISLLSGIPLLLIPKDSHWEHWMPLKAILAAPLIPKSEDLILTGAKWAIGLGSKSLHLLHVIDAAKRPENMMTPHLYPIDLVPQSLVSENLLEEKENKEKRLKNVVDWLKNEFHFPKIDGEITTDLVPNAVLEATKQSAEHNFLIIGTREESGLARVLLGSRAEDIQSEADIPILVIPEKSE